jgi:hypothetical protein
MTKNSCRPRQRATARRIVKINQANKTSKSKKKKTIKLENRFDYNQDGELKQKPKTKKKTIKLKNRFDYNQDGELDQGSY